MQLKGSCHCGAVTFEVTSKHAYPFMRCYCSICRKTMGGGGYAINLGADANSMTVSGREHLSVYRAMIDRGQGPQQSSGERNFCRHCGSGLWLFDPTWPDLIHPFASAIDTELPATPESVHIMLNYKPAWVEPALQAGDPSFGEYPDESLAKWHERHGLET